MDSALVWFRRDLRCHDHAALASALKKARRVHCAFVFDTGILADLSRQDRRVDFIHASLTELDAALRSAGGGLVVRIGRAADVIPQLADELGCDAVFANEDYEPATLARDLEVERALAAQGRAWRRFKDQVIFARDEIQTAARTPFAVFTPYKRAWLARLDPPALREHRVELPAGRLAPAQGPLPPLDAIGFAPTGLDSLRIATGARGGALTLADFLDRIDAYREARDYPARRGPSYLSVHLRFGTVSVRQLVRTAFERWRETGSAGAETWLSELVWREFYQQILWHHPHVVDSSFKPACDRLEWDEAPALFDAWCRGETGYPLVDAAIAQIRASGYMHNRLRMVVASFLTKDLGLDWRLGERWFARQLNDYDLAANNGGWQWAASTGCDAQPWFRIFNPVTQSQRFDPDGRFIRRYLPQLAGFTAQEIHAPWQVPPARQKEAGCVVGVDYPAPVVDHARARARTLARFAAIKP